MKNHIFVLFLVFLASKAQQCEPGFYSKDGYCQKCPEYCLMCSSAKECDLCEDKFFIYNGFCFPACEKPSLTFKSMSGEVYCEKPVSQEIKISNTLFTEYQSHKNFSYTYINKNFNAFASETSYWIYFQGNHEEVDENIFLLWTNIFDPLESVLNFPSLLKMQIKNEGIIISIDNNKFNLTINWNQWYFLSLYIKYPDDNSINKRIWISLFDQNREDFIYLNHSTSPSVKETIEDTIIYYGNLISNKFDLKLKNMNLKFFYNDKVAYLGYPFMIKLQFSICWPQLDLADNIKNIEIQEHLTPHLILIEQSLFELAIPLNLFEIYHGKERIYFASIDIVNSSIFVNDNGNLYEREHLRIFFSIFLIRNGSSCFLISKFTRKKIDYSDLRISFNENSYSHASFFFSKDPSVFQSFIIANKTLLSDFKWEFYTEYQLRGINVKDLNIIPKQCPESEYKYFFDISECTNPQFATKKCFEKHPNCLICENTSKCAKCKDFFLQGNCFDKCPSGFCSGKNSKVCLPCTPEIFIDYSLSACRLIFENCLGLKSCSACIEESITDMCIFSNSQVFSCTPCHSNCKACYQNDDFQYCLACDAGYFLMNGTCILNCSDFGYIESNSNCIPYCDEKSHVRCNNKCYPCIVEPNSLLPYKICPDNCVKESLKLFDENNNCIIKGEKFCYLCKYGNTLIRGYCLKFYKNDFNGKDAIKSFMNQQNYAQAGSLLFECPKSCKSCQINSEVVLECSNDTFHTNNTLIIHEQISHKNISTSSLFGNCNIIRDEFTNVQINESCIRFPTTHYYIMQPRIFFIDHISVKEPSKRYKYISICNISNNETLCLPNCPQGFYLDSKNFCFRCPENELDCKDKDNIVYTSDLTFFQGVSRPGISTTDLFYVTYDSSHNLGVLYKYLNASCPQTCKTCYFTEKLKICTQCKFENMELDTKNFFCKCKNGLKYDLTSNECVETCPESTLEHKNNCVKNCFQTTTLSIPRVIPTILEYNNFCLETCPSYYFPVISYPDFSRILCKNTHYLEIDEILIDHQKVWTQSEVKRLLNLIWDRGLHKITYHFNRLSFFEAIFNLVPMLDLDDEDIAAKILSTLLAISYEKKAINQFKKQFSIKTLINHPKNSKLAHKISYLALVQAKRFNDYRLNGWDKFVPVLHEFEAGKNSIPFYREINGQILSFDLILSSHTHFNLYGNYFEFSNGIMLGFEILSTIENDKLNISIEFKQNYRIYATIANLTSSFLVYFNIIKNK